MHETCQFLDFPKGTRWDGNIIFVEILAKILKPNAAFSMNYKNLDIFIYFSRQLFLKFQKQRQHLSCYDFGHINTVGTQ